MKADHTPASAFALVAWLGSCGQPMADTGPDVAAVAAMEAEILDTSRPSPRDTTAARSRRRAGGLADHGPPPARPAVAVGRPEGPDPVLTQFQQGVSPTAAYDGTTDATVDPTAPDDNLGSDRSCRADGDDATDLACLLRWDVSAIPRGSTVLDATLVLNVTNPSPARGAYTWFELHKAWEESEVTWNAASAGAPWQVPGAGGLEDRGAVVRAISSAAAGPDEFPLGRAGVAAVQRWVDDPAANFGLILTNPTHPDGFAFASSEATTSWQRPRLVVTWIPGRDLPSADERDAVAVAAPR